MTNSTVAYVNGNVNITIISSSLTSIGLGFGSADTVICNYAEFSGSISFTTGVIEIGCSFGSIAARSNINHIVSKC